MSRSVCQRCGASYQGVGCHLCGDTLLTHAPKDPLLGKVFAGRYRIIRKLGQGGMGAVYLAEQVGIGHRVALKLLNANLAGNEEITQRFLNEAKSYARIAHPHAVAFHEFGQDTEGNLFISTEYIEGPDLKNYLLERGRLSIHEAVEIILQIADALEHAHQNGVIHRDLKPENVIVREGMRGIHAKVLDFGIARLLEEGSERLTVAGSIAGTPQYMSPEQVRGQDVDARADVYVIGILLFELITGVQPFAAPTIPEMLYRQVNEPVPPLARFLPDHDAFDRLIQRATAKDPAARHPSMAAFAAELLEASSTLPAQTRSQGGDTAVGTPLPSALRSTGQLEGPQGTLLQAPAAGGAEQQPGGSGTFHNERAISGGAAQPAASDTLLHAAAPSGSAAGPAEGPSGTILHAGAGVPAAPRPIPEGELENSDTLVSVRNPLGSQGGAAASTRADVKAPRAETAGWSEPPSRRQRPAESRGGAGRLALVALVLVVCVAGGAYAFAPEWVMGVLGQEAVPAMGAGSAAEEAPKAEAVQAEVPKPEAGSIAERGGVEVLPAAAAGGIPEDQRLRQELLAKEIWLKANAEFLSGNLRSASEILETVPEDATIDERVTTLREQIADVTAKLAKGRAAAARGDCATAITTYGQILTRFPGIREAARGQQDCKRMLPPTLAE